MAKNTEIELEYPEGATPLDPNEIDGLIPSYISTQGQLNAVEQANILVARQWALGKKHFDVLTDNFIRTLHKRMFQDVWRWAGTYRKTDKNIGVTAYQISTSVRNLCANAATWISGNFYAWDELGARFHHKLVAIHPFSNGNGRLARLMTDVLLTANNQPVFTWGINTYDTEIGRTGGIRKVYIDALRAADQHQFDRLIQFVRS